MKVLHRFYPHLGEGEEEALERSLEEDIHGLVIAPGEPEKLKPLIRRADERGIAVLCVNTDAPGTARLTAVAVDPVTSGSLVGELMGRFLQGRGRSCSSPASRTTTDHALKLDAFRKTVDEMSPGPRDRRDRGGHDDAKEAYQKCRDVLAAFQEVTGVYVTTANSLPVLRAHRRRRAPRPGHRDRHRPLSRAVPHIRSEHIAATIHQRPWTQGRIAFQALHRFLAEGVAPLPFIGLSPHIVMKSNLRHFLDRTLSGRDKGLEEIGAESVATGALSP